jgi:hypothetical protein
MLIRGALAGTKIPGIIGIHPVCDGREAQLRTKGFHDGEELVFAVEASISVVALILGPFQFVGGHDMQRHLERLCEGAGLFHVAAGEAGRISEHGKHAGTEHAVRRSRQEGRIHAA